jgi:alpha-ketoglutarate-dependent taurine dioxygenase
MIRYNEYLLDGTDVPIVWGAAADVAPGIDDLCAWLAERRDDIEELLYRHGGILLRGFPCIKSAAEFQRVLDVLAPNLMDYVGGSAPRKAVSGRIMTATELPGNFSIPLHQEMSYTDNAPDRIAFFCEVAPTTGGQTTIGDMRRITRCIDADVLRRFEVHMGVQLRRNLPPPDKVATRPGVPKPWTEVFGTTDPAEADRIVVKSGWRAEWLDDGSMQLWQEIRPALRTHPHTGDRVWYNQAHLFSPIGVLKRARDDGRNDMVHRLEAALATAPHLLDRTFHGDGTPVADADIVHIYDVLAEEAVPLAWQPGDVLLLDNVLTAHGRRVYTGDRRILTALIRTDGAVQ